MNPKAMNFRMPAEWVEHERTFMEWPVREALCWPDNYTEFCQAFAQTAKAIAEFEPLTMLVNAESADYAAKLCGSNIEIVTLEHNDSWMRDNGPTFVVNQQGDVAGVNWQFNAWGGKYHPWDLDNLVAPRLLEKYNLRCFDAPLVLEGGSIHVDGEGTLLTTAECLLHPTRNPKLAKAEITQLVEQYLNIEKIIWLNKGLTGDETDGHIDNIACFARPGVVLMQVCNDPADPNYAITQDNLEILAKTVDAKGRKLELITIEQPPAAYYMERRLTLSYLNFYFVNGGIILPVFGNECAEFDRKAQASLQKTFPERRVITVDGLPLVKEGGNVHCLTQQMPAGQHARAAAEKL